MTMLSWWGQVIGLVIGSFGAYFLAVSQQRSQQISEGRPWGEVSAIVLEWPRLWRAGLWLLGAGFAIQLAALILQRCGNRAADAYSRQPERDPLQTKEGQDYARWSMAADRVRASRCVSIGDPSLR
jgi:drug/metabolite transporter (DMT)-like permease